MLLDKEKITFADKILKLLEPMGKIAVSEEQSDKYISKDRVVFAKICNDKFYLRDSSGHGYSLVDTETFSNNDLLLKEATNAYWIGKKEKDKITESS